MASLNPSGKVKQFKNQILMVKGLIINGVPYGGGTASAGTSLTLTEADAGKTIKLDSAAGSTVILPPSTGNGAIYKVQVTVLATSGSHVIKVSTGTTDEFRGFITQDGAAAGVSNIWWAADDNDTITLNRTTTGLAAPGEYFTFDDNLLHHFMVRGWSQASAVEATPFSTTVA